MTSETSRSQNFFVRKFAPSRQIFPFFSPNLVKPLAIIVPATKAPSRSVLRGGRGWGGAGLKAKTLIHLAVLQSIRMARQTPALRTYLRAHVKYIYLSLAFNSSREKHDIYGKWGICYIRINSERRRRGIRENQLYHQVFFLSQHYRFFALLSNED